MTLNASDIQDKTFLFYNKHPRSSATTTFYHYWCLMTINPLLSIIGSHRYTEKFQSHKIQDIHNQIRRLLPLFSACKQYCSTTIPNDSDVEKIISGSPRAWIHPDRVVVRVLFDSIARGSFFGLHNHTDYLRLPLHAKTYSSHFVDGSGGIADIVRSLLDIFHEEDKKFLWIDIMHTDNMVGAIHFWAALFPEAYDTLFAPLRNAGCTSIGTYLDVVNHTKWTQNLDNIATLKLHIEKWIRKMFGVAANQTFQMETHCWLYALVMRILIAEDLASSSSSESNTSITSFKDALNKEFAQRKIVNFANKFAPDSEWQPNAKLIEKMQASITDCTFADTCSLARALAAQRTLMPLPESTTTTSSYGHDIPFIDELMGTLGYDDARHLLQQPRIYGERQSLLRHALELSSPPNCGLIQGSNRQRMLNFMHGIDDYSLPSKHMKTVISSGDSLLPGREQFGDLVTKMGYVDPNTEFLHPAGIPTTQQQLSQRLRSFIASHVPLLAYALNRCESSSPNDISDKLIIYAPLSIKNCKEEQRTKPVAPITVMDMLGPTIQRAELPDQASLPDLYIVLSSILQNFRPSTTTTTKRTTDDNNNNSIGDNLNDAMRGPEKTTLYKLMEALFESLGRMQRLDKQKYEYWISNVPWLSQCIHTLMIGGFAACTHPISSTFICQMGFNFGDKSNRSPSWAQHGAICELALLAYVKCGLDKYPQFWKMMAQKYYAPATFFRGIAALLAEFSELVNDIGAAIDNKSSSRTYSPKLFELCKRYYDGIDIDYRNELSTKRTTADADAFIKDNPHLACLSGYKHRMNQHEDLNYFDILNMFVASRLNALGQFMVELPDIRRFPHAILQEMIDNYRPEQRQDPIMTSEFCKQLNRALELIRREPDERYDNCNRLFFDASMAVLMGCDPEDAACIAESQLRFMLGQPFEEHRFLLKKYTTEGLNASRTTIVSYLQWLAAQDDVRIVKSDIADSYIPVDYMIEPLEMLLKRHYGPDNHYRQMEPKRRQSIRKASKTVYYCPVKRQMVAPIIPNNGNIKRKFGFRTNLHEQYMLANNARKQTNSPKKKEEEDNSDSEPDGDDDNGLEKKRLMEANKEHADVIDQLDTLTDGFTVGMNDSDTDDEEQPPLPSSQKQSTTTKKQKVSYSPAAAAQIFSIHPSAAFVCQLKPPPNTAELLVNRNYNQEKKRAKKPKLITYNSDELWNLRKKQKARNINQEYRRFIKAASEEFMFAQSRHHNVRRDHMIVMAARDSELNKSKITCPYPSSSNNLTEHVLLTERMTKPGIYEPASSIDSSSLHRAVKCFQCQLFFEPNSMTSDNGEGMCCMRCLYNNPTYDANLVDNCIVCDKMLITATKVAGYSPMSSLAYTEQTPQQQQQAQQQQTSSSLQASNGIKIHMENFPLLTLVLFNQARGCMQRVHICRKCGEYSHVKRASAIANRLTLQSFVSICNESNSLSTFL